jgi:uncharacterized membrane protein YdfJ with MMPL/SSD domain
MSEVRVARDDRDTAYTGGHAMQRPWAIGAAVLAIAVVVIVIVLVVMHMNGASANGGSSGGYGY